MTSPLRSVDQKEHPRRLCTCLADGSRVPGLLVLQTGAWSLQGGWMQGGVGGLGGLQHFWYKVPLSHLKSHMEKGMRGQATVAGMPQMWGMVPAIGTQGQTLSSVDWPEIKVVCHQARQES